MPTLLLAIDGSENADRVTEHVIKLAGLYREPPQIHLLNVQMPLRGANVKLFISSEQLDTVYRDEGMAALKNARAKLDACGTKYTFHIGVGNAAEVVAQYAEHLQCDQIIMGTRGMSRVSNLILGSVATGVIQHAKVPVLLVK